MASAEQAADDPGDENPDVGGSLRRPGSDATLERLRAKILSGELPPGSVVSQTTLAKTLGISTTPLREVIRQLQAEGLLEVELNRRPRVTPLDIHDLHGVYAGRIVMESLGVLITVPTMNDEDVEQMHADLATMRALHREDRIDEWSVVHNRFHKRMCGEGPGSVATILNNLADRTERYRRLSVAAGQRNFGDADAEHERLVEACDARDGQRACVELANHLARTALSLSAAFAPQIDPLPVRLAVGLVTCNLPPDHTPGPRPRSARS